jgi:hypothetical protein
MSQGPKILILLGVVLIGAGLFWQFGPKNLPFGKLPGDISYKKGSFSFYFPLVTCLIVSAVLSILFNIFKK